MLKKIAIVGILGLLLSGCEREEPRPVETPTAPPPATEPAPGTAVEPTDPQDEIGAEPEEPVTEEPVTEEPVTEEPVTEAPATADMPEDLTFEARNGNVQFPHQAHAGMFECSACHEQDPPGAIPDWGQTVAHALCIECHKAEGAGPVACNQCHVRD